MYARFLTIQLKPNATAVFKETTEKEILPILKRRPGFQNELVLTAPDGRESIAISIWDSQQHAEAFAQESYPEVLQMMLRKVTDSAPVVKTYDVSIATFQKLAARGA